MTFRYCETHWWETSNTPNHGTLIIVMHNPEIGPAVGGLHTPEEIANFVARGLKEGGTRGVELLADAIVGAEAYHRKVSALHRGVEAKLNAAYDAAQAVGGNAFATLRAQHDEREKRENALIDQVALHAQDLAHAQATIAAHEARLEAAGIALDADPAEIVAVKATVDVGSPVAAAPAETIKAMG